MSNALEWEPDFQSGSIVQPAGWAPEWAIGQWADGVRKDTVYCDGVLVGRRLVTELEYGYTRARFIPIRDVLVWAEPARGWASIYVDGPGGCCPVLEVEVEVDD